MHTAYIGIGSNLAVPYQQIRTALRELQELPESSFIRISSVYLSKPIGPSNQPYYLNAVIQLRTTLDPFRLLAQLQRIEGLHGRKRGFLHWRPRTLDLDIILFDQQIIKTTGLTLPHPAMAQRNFVLYPLFELAPRLMLPHHKPLANLMKQCTRQGLQPYGLKPWPV